MIKLRLVIFLFVLAVLIGCSKMLVLNDESVKDYEKTIVVADNVLKLTGKDVYEIFKWSDINPYGGPVPKEKVRDVLDSIVLEGVIMMAANDINLNDFPEQQITFESRYGTLLNNLFLEEYVKKMMTADSLEVIEHFYAHPEIYTLTEQVDISQILITSKGLTGSADSLKYQAMTKEELAEATKEHAFYVHSLIGKEKLFASIAEEFSHDSYSAKSGGEIGLTKKGIYLHPFDSIAFTLNDGEWSEPYIDKDGWHIIYVKTHIPEGVPPMDEEVFKFAKLNLLIEKSNTRGAFVIDSLKANINKIEYVDETLAGNLFTDPHMIVYAVIDGIDTVKAFHIRRYEEQYRKKYQVPNTTPEMKKTMIDEAATWFVLQRAAIKYGIETFPEVPSIKNKLRTELAMVVVTNRKQPGRYDPPDSLIRKYYNEHLSEFVFKKQFNLKQILCEDSVYCEFVRDQVYTGYDFEDMIKEYSIGKNNQDKLKQGIIGDVARDDLSPEMWVAVLKIPNGEVSHPVKIGDYWRIIKKTKTYSSKSFEQAKYGIIPVLQEQHKKDIKKKFMDDLFKQYNVKYLIENFEVRLEPLGYRQ